MADIYEGGQQIELKIHLSLIQMQLTAAFIVLH